MVGTGCEEEDDVGGDGNWDAHPMSQCQMGIG